MASEVTTMAQPPRVRISPCASNDVHSRSKQIAARGGGRGRPGGYRPPGSGNDCDVALAVRHHSTNRSTCTRVRQCTSIQTDPVAAGTSSAHQKFGD